MGLVRGAVRHYCLGGCSALVVCARRSRPVRGGRGLCRVLCLPRFPLPAPRFLRCVWRAVPSGRPLSSLSGTPFHAVCACLRLCPVALLVFPACPLCVCALGLSRRLRPPPPPPRVGWARVGPFHAVRAPPRVLPRSRAPFGLLWGWAARSRLPPTWLRAGRSPWGGSALLGRSNAWGWGGGRRAGRPLRWCSRGGKWGGGVALPRSVPLPSLGRQQSGCLWRHFGHGERGPHTAPVRARLLSPGAAPAASLCAGAGLLVHRGSLGAGSL